MLRLVELVVLALVATAVVWKGSGWLETSSQRLSAHYGLPPAVQGAVVVAIGSSFPELVSVVLSTAPPPIGAGQFDLGVSAVVGSAVFNLLVIPAVSGILGDTVSASRAIVYKEAQFYMVAVSAVVITFALAVIYYPTPDRLVGTVTRPLAAMPVLLYGVYVFTQYQDTADFDAPDPGEIDIARQWGWLALSLVTIAVAVEGLVEAAVGFGEFFGTPSFLWGLTVIAAGTSLPDTLVSVRAARDGRGETSLANVLGSNVFDLLVAVPVGVLIVGAVPVNFGVAIPLLGFLTVATVIVFGFLRTELTLSVAESYVLLGLYVVFLVWMTLETFGVLGFVPGA
ncbi:sodium:calcium antiporter [Haloglomus irregulare]|jgi:cation:H+ antiporter|uniref:Sodium:calcium antiporter n=1 Tax=Haloglomus irregulare TaxID=2234134 RepID=A0A554NCX7_9EURY|nr:sodium:calcium antiporter [Haloglomus irregulare]TSD14880.1 sodium:calcium antiporter [Haloglomus irregulare]